MKLKTDITTQETQTQQSAVTCNRDHRI